MPYFEDIDEFIATVTDRLTKPARGVGGSEGITREEIRQALIDVARRAEDILTESLAVVGPSTALLQAVYDSMPRLTTAELRALSYNPLTGQPAYYVTDKDEFFRYSKSEAGADNGTTILVSGGTYRWVKTSLFQAAYGNKSTYELWLDAGNTGDLAAFLAAQKGAPGTPGAAGAAGGAGAPGTPAQTEAIPKTGTAIELNEHAIYGYPTVVTASLTVNAATAKMGQVALVRHNAAAMPGVPGQFKVIAGKYKASVDNFLYIICAYRDAVNSANNVYHVTISQVIV